MIFQKLQHAEEDINESKNAINNYIKTGTDHCIEKYSASILDRLEKQSKMELMRNIKIKPTDHNDMNSKIIKEY